MSPLGRLGLRAWRGQCPPGLWAADTGLALLPGTCSVHLPTCHPPVCPPAGAGARTPPPPPRLGRRMVGNTGPGPSALAVPVGQQPSVGPEGPGPAACPLISSRPRRPSSTWASVAVWEPWWGPGSVPFVSNLFPSPPANLAGRNTGHGEQRRKVFPAIPHTLTQGEGAKTPPTVPSSQQERHGGLRPQSQAVTNPPCPPVFPNPPVPAASQAPSLPSVLGPTGPSGPALRVGRAGSWSHHSQLCPSGLQ